MRRWYRSGTAFVGLALVASLVAACGGGTTSGSGGPTGQSYCIGTDFPVSGTDGTEGLPAEHGADLAIAQAKLPNSNTLKVVNFDDAVNGAHNATQGATNVTTMIGNSCILAMVGPFNSGVAGAEIPIATAAGLGMISPANTNPGLTKQQYAQQYGYDFAKMHPSGKPEAYFRVPTTDDVQGAVDAQLALAAGFKKAYVIDDSESYGKGLADFFTQNFTSGGGATAGRDSITANNTAQFSSLVTKMAATSPDLVFFGGVTSGGGAALRAAMSAGSMASIPMYGGDGIAQDPSFVSIAGASAANGTVGTVAAPDIAGLTSSAAQSFASAFQAKYNAQAIAYSVNSYDAANIEIKAISDIISSGQTPTRALVLAKIAGTSYDGITGHISFDANGDNAGAKVLSVYKVTGGNWVFVKQVNG